MIRITQKWTKQRLAFRFSCVFFCRRCRRRCEFVAKITRKCKRFVTLLCAAPIYALYLLCYHEMSKRTIYYTTNANNNNNNKKTNNYTKLQKGMDFCVNISKSTTTTTTAAAAVATNFSTKSSHFVKWSAKFQSVSYRLEFKWSRTLQTYDLLLLKCSGESELRWQCISNIKQKNKHSYLALNHLASDLCIELYDSAYSAAHRPQRTS